MSQLRAISHQRERARRRPIRAINYCLHLSQSLFLCIYHSVSQNISVIQYVFFLSLSHTHTLSIILSHSLVVSPSFIVFSSLCLYLYLSLYISHSLCIAKYIIYFLLSVSLSLSLSLSVSVTLNLKIFVSRYVLLSHSVSQ